MDTLYIRTKVKLRKHQGITVTISMLEFTLHHFYWQMYLVTAWGTTHSAFETFGLILHAMTLHLVTYGEQCLHSATRHYPWGQWVSSPVSPLTASAQWGPDMYNYDTPQRWPFLRTFTLTHTRKPSQCEELMPWLVGWCIIRGNLVRGSLPAACTI